MKENTMSLYLEDLDYLDVKQLEIKQEREYLKKIKNNDQNARKKFIEINLPLVVLISKEFYLGSDIYFSMVDLIQQGTLGLIYAIDKFDLTMQNKFSTYAGMCIRGYIKKYIERHYVCIHTPLGLVRRIKKINNVLLNIPKNISEKEKIKIISKRTGLSEKQILKALKYDYKVFNYGGVDFIGLNEEYMEFQPNVQYPTSALSYKIESDILNKMSKKDISNIIHDILFNIDDFSKKILIEVCINKQKISKLEIKYGISRYMIQKTIKDTKTKILNNAKEKYNIEEILDLIS